MRMRAKTQRAPQRVNESLRVNGAALPDGTARARDDALAEMRDERLRLRDDLFDRWRERSAGRNHDGVVSYRGDRDAIDRAIDDHALGTER